MTTAATAPAIAKRVGRIQLVRTFSCTRVLASYAGY